MKSEIIEAIQGVALAFVVGVGLSIIAALVTAPVWLSLLLLTGGLK